MLNKTIYEDGNGGQQSFSNNDIMTTNSLATLAYIAMFGGGREANTKPLSDSNDLNLDWWGNDKSKASSTWLNSETERVLTGIVLNSRSLETIKKAVKKDTQKLTEFGDIDVAITIVGVNKVRIDINIIEPDGVSNERLALVWDSTKNEIIENIIL